MSTQGQRLFDLLPALYRLKDAQLAQSQNLAQGPLQSLLMLIEEQFAVVADDLNQLYDDQFIETCAPWVIPYIGDLIGYQPVHGVATAVASPRAEVANTISFRRRKGTILVLEQLARDVTGWGAHATELFKVLAAAQYMKFIRPDNHYAPDLRRWQVREYMDTGFDRTAHKIDVRRIETQDGRYNIQNIGVFLWSLNAYSITNGPLTAVGTSGQFFRFSPLGADMPLFNNPVSQGSDITVAATPVNVPARLQRRVLCQDIQSGAGAAYYGEGNSLALYLGGQLQNAYQIRVCNLSGADGSWINVPTANGPYTAAIDPELGRVALAAPLASGVPQASFYYGFNGDMGGGEYSRSDSFVVQTENSVLPFPDTASSPRYATLQEALTFAAGNLGENDQIAVEITDSGIYPLSSSATPPTSALQINAPAGATIELRAADECRPTLLLGEEITVNGGVNSSFVLNGLVLAYTPPSATAPIPTALVHVPYSSTNLLNQLVLSHCTLVPGLALTSQGTPQFAGNPVLVTELPALQLIVQKSILGGVQVQALSSANISDSIVDACGPTGVAYAATDGVSGGGSLTLQGCTVIGKVHATLFTLISDSIVWAELAPSDTWTAALLADRKQQGCVRFSYLPAVSVVPREFECIQAAIGVARPMFYSLQYGQPGYAKLLPLTDDSIRRGADDGGEMGAFHFVLAPLRETDLQVRLQEYLPVGLEFGIFYQN
jgi:hypothetical protein